MYYPEEYVLIGVINRKRDLVYAREGHWYRIPQKQFPNGIFAQHLGFFLSGSPFKAQNGGVHYHAPVLGFELKYRHELLPREGDHPRAKDLYYRVAIGDLLPKHPPILNPTKRSIAFIHTTWDRFVHAENIADLYSENDYFVDRIYHALNNNGIDTEQYWGSRALGLRVLYDDGEIRASTVKSEGVFHLDASQGDEAVFRALIEEIKRRGVPVTLGIPREGL